MIDEFRDGGSRLNESYRKLVASQLAFNAEIERLLTGWDRFSPEDRASHHKAFFSIIDGAHPLQIESMLKIKNLPSEWRRELEAML